MSFYRARLNEKLLNLFIDNFQIFSYIINMSDLKNKRIFKVLKHTMGIERGKEFGTEFRFNYVFGALHFPVVMPSMKHDVWAKPIKRWWEYGFYDYAHTAKNLLYDHVKGETYVTPNSCSIVSYDKMTVPKLPAFLELQMECIRKVIQEIEQRKIENILDNLQ